MAFGWAGAAAGTSRELEDIVTQRILAKKLEEEIANRQKQTSLDEAALNQRSVEHSDLMRARQRDDDRLDNERRERDGRQGVRRMIGESLMQGGTPDRRALAAMQIEAGDAPTMLNEPKPERDPIADYEARKKLDRQYDRPAVARPERPQVFQVNGKLVDANGRVVFDGGPQNAPDPAKAQQTKQSMIETARALRNHPGLANLTGARIGNPDYGLGVSDEPLAGSKAADAKPFYDRLKALFTVDNLGLLKGVLSDSDMKILGSIGTSLDTKMQDPTFAGELDSILQKLEGGGGLASMNPSASHAPTGAKPASKFTIVSKQ